MKKTLKTSLLHLAATLLIMSSGYGQEPGEQSGYKKIAIGIDPINTFLIGPLLFDATIIVGNLEYALSPKLSVMAEFEYYSDDDNTGTGIGGAVRYYSKAKAVKGSWYGGHLNFISSDDKSAIVVSALMGRKFILGPVFIDPFVGIRLPQVLGNLLRYGVNVGLVF